MWLFLVDVVPDTAHVMSAFIVYVSIRKRSDSCIFTQQHGVMSLRRVTNLEQKEGQLGLRMSSSAKTSMLMSLFGFNMLQ